MDEGEHAHTEGRYVRMARASGPLVPDPSFVVTAHSLGPCPLEGFLDEDRDAAYRLQPGAMYLGGVFK